MRLIFTLVLLLSLNCAEAAMIGLRSPEFLASMNRLPPVADAGGTNHAGYGTNIAECSLWLEASDVSDIASGWTDRKNGWIFRQPTESKRPTVVSSAKNGKPALAFDGTDDWLTNGPVRVDNLSSTGQVCVFIVLEQTNTIANSKLLGINAGGNEQIGLFATYADTIYFDAFNVGAARISVGQPVAWDNNWHILELVRSNAYMQIMADGNSLATGGALGGSGSANTYPLYISDASGLPFGGMLSEVLMFTNAGIDRVYIRTNLAAKYAITLP